MNTKTLTTLFAAATLLTGCDKSPNIASESKQVQAEPFHGQVYRSFNGSTTLTLISRDECEINEGRTTLLCKYTKQSDALRVVVTAMGSNQVIYYRITDQGIQDNNGNVLLSPDRYAAAVEQARIEREAQLARQRAAELEQQRQREMERQREEERKKALIAKRDAVVQDVRKYFSKGTVLQGKRRSEWSYKHKDPNLPFEVAITGEITVEDQIKTSDLLDQVFEVPAHYKWLQAVESMTNSSWGKDREYDGRFIGRVEVNQRTEPPQIEIAVMYYVRDDRGSWDSKGKEAIWNGTTFEGKGDGTIDLAKP